MLNKKQKYGIFLKVEDSYKAKKRNDIKEDIAIFIFTFILTLSLFSVQYMPKMLKQRQTINTLNEIESELRYEVSEARETIYNLSEEIENNKEIVQNAKDIENEIDGYKKEVEYLKSKVTAMEKYKEKSASRGTSRNMKKVTFEVTMYTNAGGAPPYKGLMANGKYTKEGVVAAPKSIPFGTEVMLDRVPDEWGSLKRIYEVSDRGGAIIEKSVNGEKVICIDIWTDNKEEAKRWGRRKIEGWLIYK